MHYDILTDVTRYKLAEFLIIKIKQDDYYISNFVNLMHQA